MLDWGSDDSYHPGRAEMLSTEDIPSWLLAVVAAVTFVLGAFDYPREVLRRFREKGIAAARVTTSGHPFFAPALAMYRSLGFGETRRFAGGPDPRYRLVELEKALPG